MKVVVLLDVWNIIAGAETDFGKQARPDFGYLLVEARRIFPTAVAVDGVSFMSRFLRTNIPHDGIKKACYASGFHTTIIKRAYRPIETGQVQPNQDVDIDLVVWALTHGLQYDAVVVASGDGDYIPLYDALRGMKKAVAVLSYRSSLFKDVVLHVDNLTVLNEPSLWTGPVEAQT